MGVNAHMIIIAMHNKHRCLGLSWNITVHNNIKPRHMGFAHIGFQTWVALLKIQMIKIAVALYAFVKFQVLIE